MSRSLEADDGMRFIYNVPVPNRIVIIIVDASGHVLAHVSSLLGLVSRKTDFQTQTGPATLEELLRRPDVLFEKLKLLPNHHGKTSVEHLQQVFNVGLILRT